MFFFSFRDFKVTFLRGTFCSVWILELVLTVGVPRHFEFFKGFSDFGF